jgi:hypothetical protein
LHGSALTPLALNDLFLFWSKHRMAMTLGLTSGWCKSRSKGSVLLVMMRRAWQESGLKKRRLNRAVIAGYGHGIFTNRGPNLLVAKFYPRGSTTRPELLMQLDEQGLVFKANIRTNGYSVAS